MSTSKEGPNPLRPYYVPPSVGRATDISHHGVAVSNTSKAIPTTAQSLGSSARNILSDIDYTEYLAETSPSSTDVVRRLIEHAIWKYTSVLFAQPFDVVKTILQVYSPTKEQNTKTRTTGNTRRRPSTYSQGSYENLSEDSDLDSPSYFTTNVPPNPTPTRSSRARRRRRSSPSPDGIPRVHTPRSPPRRPKSIHALELRSTSSVLSCLSTLWSTEGAWGVWKGTNCSYIYSLLLSSLTSLLRSFLSALLALPDPGLSLSSVSPSSFSPGGLDILSSPSPLSSLFVSASAAGLAGVLLSPLDITRTRLMLTPSTHSPRSIIGTLYTLPSWMCSLSLAPITTLYAVTPTFISASTPLFLRSRLGIDPLLTPNLYAIGTFCSQAAELAIKLPLETVLRRGQIAFAKSTPKNADFPTIVEVGPYKGIYGTMRSIVYEEGETSGPADLVKGVKATAGGKTNRVGQEKKTKGQGAEGLWRGWRVGMWGLIGVWGAATMGGAGGKSGEF